MCGRSAICALCEKESQQEEDRCAESRSLDRSADAGEAYGCGGGCG